MKTYWLKGKQDLSFKTPAELRYSSEQKDSEDKSSNGWVDRRRAVSTKESLFFCTQCALCWFSQSCAHCPLQHQIATNWKAVVGAFVWGSHADHQKQKFHSYGAVQPLGYWIKTKNKTWWDKTGNTVLQKSSETYFSFNILPLSIV